MPLGTGRRFLSTEPIKTKRLKIDFWLQFYILGVTSPRELRLLPGAVLGWDPRGPVQSEIQEKN